MQLLSELTFEFQDDNVTIIVQGQVQGTICRSALVQGTIFVVPAGYRATAQHLSTYGLSFYKLYNYI